MKTITMKTQDLTGKALDWAVGVAAGNNPELWQTGINNEIRILVEGEWTPTTNWGQLGQLVDKLWLNIIQALEDHLYEEFGEGYIGWHHFIDQEPEGKAVWFCRAIVAARIGDTVDVPEVLV